MATRRTTMRSRTGTKLYAVRDESGKFKDIQTYKRAHTADMRHKSKAEKEAAQGPHSWDETLLDQLLNPHDDAGGRRPPDEDRMACGGTVQRYRVRAVCDFVLCRAWDSRIVA